MQANALDLRKGNLVRYQGNLSLVVYWNILKNDRRQFVQMRVKNIETGRIAELKEHGDTKFELLDNEVIDLSYSYRDGNDAVFYSTEGEEYRCSHEVAEEAIVWQCEAYKGFIVEGHLVSVSPPQSVVATVVDTSPPVRGGGNSGLKDAVLDNGVKVRVGLIIDRGDKVRIDPETLEFKERA